MRRIIRKTTFTDYCWTTNSLSHQININRKMILITRYVYSRRFLQNIPVPSTLMVCHHCDNPNCWRFDHLFLGTNQDNMFDMVNKGRQEKGERNHNSKLTNAQVRRIRAIRAKTTLRLVDIGNIFGVSNVQIYKITTNQQRKYG